MSDTGNDAIEAGVIEVGTAAEPRSFGPMTTQMFVRYSGASGDLNPMHYDDAFAKQAGYPSVFSQGMHQAALLATFAPTGSAPRTSAASRFASGTRSGRVTY